MTHRVKIMYYYYRFSILCKLILFIFHNLNNMETDKLIEDAEMLRFIKAQRIEWFGHIQRMDQARPARKLLDWKPVGTRPVGRPRPRTNTVIPPRTLPKSIFK
jgi:hypothetical protein